MTWRIARNVDMSGVVASGTVSTGPDTDHTVKVDVDGLSADTTYFYDFRTNDAASAVGTTHTAPANDADIDAMRFGVVSCSNWESGYFGAYRHLAARGDLDAIVHLGDYIYEYETGGFPGRDGVVRQHSPTHEIVTLADYRQRHGQYKSDPDLQAAHVDVPWICTWDDHESANDAYDGGAENHTPATEGDWYTRKANSEKAYYEWMPVRAAGTATNRHLYRRLRFGNLLELSMLDLRTYRSQQVLPFNGPEVDSPNRTITGAEQMQWLTDGIVSSPTQWKIVGNPVMITPTLIPPLDRDAAKAVTSLLGIPEGGLPYNADPWDGYTADRRKLLGAIVDCRRGQHGLHHRRHPLRLGLRGTPRRSALRNDGTGCHRARRHLGELGQHRRSDAHSAAHAGPGRRGSVQGAQPAREVRRPRQSRFRRLRGHQDGGSDGPLVPHRQGGSADRRVLGSGLHRRLRHRSGFGRRHRHWADPPYWTAWLYRKSSCSTCSLRCQIPRRSGCGSRRWPRPTT